MTAAGFEPVKGKIIADDKWHQASYMGEKAGKLSGTYSMKIVSDDFAIGTFFTRKDPDNKFKWHSKSDQKLSPEERKRIKKEIAAQQRHKEIEDEKRQLRISKRLTKVFEKLPKATDDHPYLVKKGVKAHGIRYRKKGNELIIPLRGADTKIWTIQRITPEGAKFLFAGGRKKSSYFPFASAKETLDKLILCEGYATGASIRESTGLPVFSAIDSGNLKPVLLSLKQKYPLARFIIGADNDAFTQNAKKEPWNVGIEKANEAAGAIGGAYVCFPDFSGMGDQEYKERRPTDFNDLASSVSREAVRDQITDFIKGIPARDEAAASDDTLSQSYVDQHAGGGDFIDGAEWERDYATEAANTDPLKGDFEMNFKILGYNQGVYYYFPFVGRQIVALTASAHTMNNLFRLDNLDNWMSKFGAGGDTSEKKMVMYATSALMNVAERRCVFKEEDRVRGCGAWTDEGRKILHCGDVLYVDGVETKFDQLKSEYTYIAASKLMRPAHEPLTNREAYALREICEAVTWENKLSGSLLAGWLVIAPVCGALGFRPHVYITGEAESGKSTVLNKIVKPVIGRISINLDGGTTEPAIRQMMEYDARPLVYDEAEKSPHMAAVLSLARAATDGKAIKKFGQGMMYARFCACFSAINPPVDKVSDESRIAFMVIKKNRRPTAMEEYNQLLDMIEKTITPDYANRMLARTMQNMDVLFENIKTFQKAARRVIKGARASEVIGTMLAGLYLLRGTDLVTLEAAEAWIRERDWTSHTIIDKETDPVRLLQYISGCILRLQGSGSTKDYSIGDLIVMAQSQDDADKLLRYNGIAVKGGRVHFAARSPSLEKMLKDTDWSTNPTRMLANMEGAETFKIMHFSTGVKTSGVSLPISIFTDKEYDRNDQTPQQLEIPDYMQEIPF